MGKFVDLIGKRFGRLTVICKDGIDKQGGAVWLCECKCGNVKPICSRNLIHSNVQSCGCLTQDVAREAKTTHGFSNTRLYNIWEGIKRRCLSDKHSRYYDYGGRGIKVCEEWKCFEPFKDWAMINGYSENLTIERKNVNGNYEPSNCTWATKEEQAHNTRIRSNNTSGFNGVSIDNKTQKWRAQIYANGKKYYLGSSSIIGDAISARKAAELKYWGKEKSG